jgi:hypothetical protein
VVTAEDALAPKVGLLTSDGKSRLVVRMMSIARSLSLAVVVVMFAACSSTATLTGGGGSQPDGGGSDSGEMTDGGTPSDGAAGGCSLPEYPKPSCTGVPANTQLTDLPPNEAGAYRVQTDGEVIDGKHITGDLLITANGVTIRNSQIDGTVLNEYGTTHYPFTITDSTVGPVSGCISAPGVGEADYTATRVHVRGHDDGFRVSGNNVNIFDSFAKLCANPGSHSDGIQSYCPTASCTGVLFRHNTVDARNVDATFMVNLVDPNVGTVTVSDSLLMGGAYTLVTQWHSGPKWVVHDNRVVDQAWAYGPASTENTCANQDWAGNSIVTIDSDYHLTSTVGALACID